MNFLKSIFNEDIKKYHYLMTEKEIKNYTGLKIKYMILGLILGSILVIGMHFETIYILIGLGLGLLGNKLPFIMLKLRHNEICNQIVDGIPIWINSIYSLIGENNIYNAIALSYENAPDCMKPDLKIFIDKISINNSDRTAYLEFLSRFEVDGFRDIMMKIYEFRNLSKDKLKYEITALNDTLGKLEALKRRQRHKQELFIVDILGSTMIGIPCIYMLYASMLLSDLMM